MHLTVDDLTQLDQLNCSTVKKCLQSRYQDKLFYTWAGPTLVALNPLREVAKVYSRDVVQLFAHETVPSPQPHIFAIGQRALRHLQWGLGKVDQAIVVNGESGAGKTRSALHLLSYLAAMETNNNEVDHSKNIEVLLCQSNPLLEAMGNAATLRNENSSRFGKLIRLGYKGEGVGTELASAHIETYLLESTRVALQAKGERNFHIFYQMLAGLPADLQEKLSLNLGQDWAIASSSDCTKRDEEEFKKTVQSLGQLFTEDMINNFWCLLAALLHLGNLDFYCQNRQWHTNALDHLLAANQLVGLKENRLWDLLTTRSLQAGSNIVVQPCSTSSECEARRDTLMKVLYRLAFDFILQGVNHKLNSSALKKDCKFLCILDLYGFESFEYGNSLEQLCINYANERLQHYFTVNYLKEQQVHLRNEGLNFDDLDVNTIDKENVIAVLDGPISVFGVLNEECYLNRGCDDSQVCQRIQSALVNPTRGVKSVPASPRTPRACRAAAVVEFTLNHYAGPVTYSTVSMLDKNRDHVPAELIVSLSKSKNSFLRNLISSEMTASIGNTKTGRRHTVLAKFKSSLDNLMKILNACDVSYVRCIRPTTNSFSGQSHWDEDYVEAQLNACGVCDTIRVSSFGYPIRMSHEDFADRYKSLVVLQGINGMSDAVTVYRKILDFSPGVSREIRIGKNQVYATEHGLHLLEKRKSQIRYRAAVAIQRWWRHQLIRRDQAARVLQRMWRQKRCTTLMLQRLKHLSTSVGTVKKALRRWIFTKRLTKSIRSRVRARAVAVVPPLPPRTDHSPISSPIRLFPSPEKKSIKTEYISRQVFSGLVLQLPRSLFFYQDGIISIRQPPTIRIRFSTKKTCLPYSHMLPQSLMPSGLTDALACH